jgi:hypothetical protein
MSKSGKARANIFDNQLVLAQFRRDIGSMPHCDRDAGGRCPTQPIADAVVVIAKATYSRGAGSDVKREMHRYKRGTARSGRGGRGGKVKSRKQAIAIGLSKARKKGKKVPKKRA